MAFFDFRTVANKINEGKAAAKNNQIPAGFYSPNTASPTYQNPYTGPWDVSGMQQGSKILSGQGSKYNPTAYNPVVFKSSYNPAQFKTAYQPTTFKTAYQPTTFTTPGLSSVGSLEDVGPIQGAGPYGVASDQEMADTYGAAMNTASRPLRAQSAERMRELNQGFGGGRLTGGAMGSLALKNSMQTGANLRDIGSGIGSTMAERRLSQGETARGAEFQNRADINAAYNAQKQLIAQGRYAEAQAIRDKLFETNVNKQDKQAKENQWTAGFGREGETLQSGENQFIANFGRTGEMNQAAENLTGANFKRTGEMNQAAENLTGANFRSGENRYGTENEQKRGTTMFDQGERWLNAQVGMSDYEKQIWQQYMGSPNALSGITPVQQ